MNIKIGINGFGRIGRIIFREAQKRKNIQIVGINDLLDIKYIAYMLKYDSTHGTFQYNISMQKNYLIINNQKIRCSSEQKPKNIKWDEINANIIIESTGIFLTKKQSYQHIIAGAKKVIVTAPSKDIPMFVMGVNHKQYSGQKIVSNASCTTNCLAPLAKVIHDNFHIIEGLMTTVHAATATQKVVDSPSNKDWRGGRSTLQNIIPSSTGAAQAVGKIIPELNNKLTGIAFRVPIANVSVIDFTVKINQSTSFQKICKIIKNSTKKNMKNIIGYSKEQLVSSDFNGTKLISIFDKQASLSLNKNFVKLIAWYDNETGYSNKVLDLSLLISK